jgi:hypothetical protein
MSSLNTFDYLENNSTLINNLLNLSPLIETPEPELSSDKLSNMVDEDILRDQNIATSVAEEVVRINIYIYTKYN